MNDISKKIGRLVVYSKSMLRKRFPGTRYTVVGEIGNLTRNQAHTVTKVLESDVEVRIYPVGSHFPLIDHKVGYVLIDYDMIAVLYESRIPFFKAKIK